MAGGGRVFTKEAPEHCALARAAFAARHENVNQPCPLRHRFFVELFGVSFGKIRFNPATHRNDVGCDVSSRAAFEATHAAKSFQYDRKPATFTVINACT